MWHRLKVSSMIIGIIIMAIVVLVPGLFVAIIALSVLIFKDSWFQTATNFVSKW